jgi:hypothetical protein
MTDRTPGIDQLVPPTRHPPGIQSRLTLDERREIQALRIGQALSISEIARRTGRRRETVSHACQGNDFDELQRHFDDECRKVARQRLAGGITKAADCWVSAVGIAGAKGDHRPAKDLLLHTDTIRPVAEGNTGPQIVVQIGVKDSDITLAVDPNASKAAGLLPGN